MIHPVVVECFGSVKDLVLVFIELLGGVGDWLLGGRRFCNYTGYDKNYKI